MDLTPSPVQSVRWIGLYSKVIVTAGVIILAAAIGYGTVMVVEYINKQTKPDTFLFALSVLAVVEAAIYGLLACALADLLAYVAGLLPMAAGKLGRKSWLLHHVDIGLYLLAGLGLLSSFMRFHGLPIKNLGWQIFLIWLLSLAKAAVLVALGLVVRRALPIIKESRTLI